MKSKFWAGVALLALLSFAPFAFGRSTSGSKALHVSSPVGVPANLLAAFFGPRGGNNNSNSNGHTTSNWSGGGSGCGQGGNGGWGGGGGNGCCGGGGNGGGNGGWGGGGGGGCVPEGGNSLEYLALGALACVGAIVYRTRRQNAVSVK
jgi:hypothetical protein